MLIGLAANAVAPAYAITTSDLDTLVSLARDAGTDPYGVAMLLYEESAGFNPASPGPAKANPQVGGLNQMSTPNLPKGITRAQWLAMSAAEQLPYIFAFWKGLAQGAGVPFPPTGPLLLALNFLPTSYAKSGAATNPNAVIAGKAGPYAGYYAGNTWYDPQATGAITPSTIAARFAQEDANAAPRWTGIKQGIAAATSRAIAGGGVVTLPPVVITAPPVVSPSSPAPASLSPSPPGGLGGGGALVLIAMAAAVAWFVAKERS